MLKIYCDGYKIQAYTNELPAVFCVGRMAYYHS